MSYLFNCKKIVKLPQFIVVVAFVSTLLMNPSAKVLADPAESTVPSECTLPARVAQEQGTRVSRLVEGFASVIGQETSFSLPTLNIKDSPFNNGSRTMWWRSGVWLVPAIITPPPSTLIAGSSDVIGDFVAAIGRNPDPGSRTKNWQAKVIATGWDEGTNLRREEVLNCAYAVTHDARLIPPMRAAAAANLDTNRYYGPPQRASHNHGTMANLALKTTGLLLNDTKYVASAVKRLQDSLPGVFPSRGFTIEQSSQYHRTNINLWTQVRNEFSSIAPASFLRVLDDYLSRATLWSDLLTSPNGAFQALGDGDGSTGVQFSSHSKLYLFDNTTGIAAGRWSWTDSNTSQYAFRYGPSNKYHGHRDHGSVVWSTLGTNVLVDPGSYSYDPRNAMAAWQFSPEAHNSAVPERGRVIDQPSSLLVLRQGNDISHARLKLGTFSVPVTRDITVSNSRHSLTISDAASTRLVQHFHFDPCWSVTNTTSRSVVLVCGSKQLVVSTIRGARITTSRGQSAPVAGWVFTGFETALPSTEVMIYGGRSFATTLTVSETAQLSPAAHSPARQLHEGIPTQNLPD